MVLFKPMVIALALALALPALANAASRQRMSHHQVSARAPATAATATHSKATSRKQLVPHSLRNKSKRQKSGISADLLSVGVLGARARSHKLPVNRNMTSMTALAALWMK